MLDLRTLQVDADKDQDGVEVEIGPTAKILVARMGNPKYTALYERLMGPYQIQKEAGLLSDDMEEEITATVIANSILLGWEGLSLDGKTELPYSPAKAKELLINPEFRPFRGLVMQNARNLDNFRKIKKEDLEKNLVKSSPGV